MIRPILFNTEMVRAIQEGRKTVTRRIAKPLCGHTERCDGAPWDEMSFFVSPLTGAVYYEDCKRQVTVDGKVVVAPCKRKDILWVREAWGDYRECDISAEGAGYYLYRADYTDGAKTDVYQDGTIYDLPRWRPSIHMPKEAARFFLKVEGVWVERLQEIDGADLLEEGIDRALLFNGPVRFAFDAFQKLWDSTIQKDKLETAGWAADPWVWVIRFRVCEKPEGWPG